MPYYRKGLLKAPVQKRLDDRRAWEKLMTDSERRLKLEVAYSQFIGGRRLT